MHEEIKSSYRGNGAELRLPVVDASSSSRPERSTDCFAESGETAALMRSIDWSKTPVGPVEKWPQSLKTALSILLTQKTPVFIFWGPEHVQFYNDAYRPILGTSKHPSAMGQRGQDCWREIWDVIEPMLNAVHGGESTAVMDGLLEIDRNGYLEEFYFNYTFSPIRDESGYVGGVFCVVYDTTQRVIGERRLKTLRDLAGHGNQARTAEDACRLAATTLESNRHDVPFASLYLFDEQREKACLVACSGIAHGTAASQSGISLTDEASALGRAARIGGIQSINLAEIGFTELPGCPWLDPPISGVVVPIISPDKSAPDGFAFVGINPRKRLDRDYETFLKLAFGHIGSAIASARGFEEEKKRNAALAELDRAKTLFFSNVSHEFRTPLALMLGPIEDMMAVDDGLAPEQRQRLELAHRNSMRLLKLVNTLLDFSRIEAGRIEACYEPTNLGQFTSELASLFHSAIERAGLSLIINCDELGEPVYVDHELWEKIVFNLLSNALKFTFNGEIEVSLKRAKDAAELAIRDTGTGIPPQDLPHLFERFYRVKGAQGRTFEGSGIGLAFVQELAKLHGGTVSVESKENQGSRFVVNVPLGTNHLPADRIGAQHSRASTGLAGETYIEEALQWLPDVQNTKEFLSNNVLSPAHVSGTGAEKRSLILLADDNADMREYVRKLLSPNFEVEVVPDGERALEAIREHPPDLILSDAMMPRLDGFGLLKQLRSDDRTATIPFIMLSARAGEESRIEGVAAGADDYLTKPFSARELLARVNSHLNMARMLRESNERNERQRRLYQTILSNTPDLVYVFDLNHRFSYANEALLRMWGKTWDEASGKNCLQLGYEPWHAAMHDQEIELVIATKKPIRGEVPFSGTNGRRIYDYIFVPVIGPDGEVEAIAGTTRDITERKQTEDALRHSEERFRALVNATSYVVYRMSPDWSEMRQLEGRGFISDTGKPRTDWVEEYIHPDDRQLVLHTIREAVRSKSMFELEHRVCRTDGSLGWTYSRAIPLFDDKGEIIEWFGAASDVTARRDAEERYRKLAETLDAEVRARTRELERRNGDVLRQSEELRDLSQRLLRAQDEERRHIARELHDSAGQTLTVLGMSLAQLAQDVARPAPQALKQVEAATNLVQQLHQEIRTTSYLLHPPLLEESGLASALAWYIEGLAQRTNIEIGLNIAGDFGRIPSDMELVVFRFIQESLTNIHRHSGAKKALIEVVRNGENVSVHVGDNGKGMSPEKLAEIQSGGFGVGIRGMRERIRQFQGTMNIESSPKGTRISVVIPLRPGDLVDPQAGSEPLEAAV